MVGPGGGARALLAAIALLVTPAWAQGDGGGQQLAADLIVRRVAPGVWLHVSFGQEEGGVRVPANGLLVATGEKSLLVDVGWNAEQTRRLLEWAQRALGQPVVHVILTHAHPDRAGGLAAVLAQPIVVQAHTLAVEELHLDHGPYVWPVEFEESLEMGHEKIYLFYPGPGHSNDNLVVWLPRTRTLFAGCLIQALAFEDLGSIDEASLTRWPLAVRRVIERYRDVRILIPGHGPTGGPELLSHTMELLERAQPIHARP